MADRYYVVGVTGYSVGSGPKAALTSYSVLDRAECHREVARFYVEDGPVGDKRREFRAEDRAAFLNGLERAREKAGV